MNKTIEKSTLFKRIVGSGHEVIGHITFGVTVKDAFPQKVSYTVRVYKTDRAQIWSAATHSWSALAGLISSDAALRQTIDLDAKQATLLQTVDSLVDQFQHGSAGWMTLMPTVMSLANDGVTNVTAVADEFAFTPNDDVADDDTLSSLVRSLLPEEETLVIPLITRDLLGKPAAVGLLGKISNMLGGLSKRPASSQVESKGGKIWL